MTSRLETIFRSKVFGQIPDEYRLLAIRALQEAEFQVRKETLDGQLQEITDAYNDLQKLKAELFGTKVTPAPVLEIESSGHVTG